MIVVISGVFHPSRVGEQDANTSTTDRTKTGKATIKAAYAEGDSPAQASKIHPKDVPKPEHEARDGSMNNSEFSKAKSDVQEHDSHEEDPAATTANVSHHLLLLEFFFSHIIVRLMMYCGMTEPQYWIYVQPILFQITKACVCALRQWKLGVPVRVRDII